MNRIGFVLKVRKERIDEYRRAHDELWPEMAEALRRHGWHNYSLFVRSDGLLFGYFETPGSLADALTGMATEEVNTRWQDKMAPYFEGTGEHPDRTLDELVEVFHVK